MATPGVGQDIEDVCSRCGDTWHVVMAKMGDRVIKVVCKLCSVQHNYRGEKNAPASSSSSQWNAGKRRKSVKRVLTPPAPPTFDPSKPPKAYSIQASFAMGERIVHPSFGTGVVAGTPGPGKVDVVFPGGPRTLACSKVSSSLERPVAASHVPIADRPPDKEDGTADAPGHEKSRPDN